MQQLGTASPENQTKIFFNHLKIDRNLFTEENQIAILATFYKLLEVEDIGSPPESIRYNKKTYYAPEDILDIPVKFLVELVNIELNHETFEYFHAVPALLYRKDWSKPFSKAEYLEGQELFYTAPFIFSLWAVSLFEQLVVTLQDNYPILYKGDKSDSSNDEDGRKMYGLIRILANHDATKMKQAEELEIWRAFTWIEQEKIDLINKKNANSDNPNQR